MIESVSSHSTDNPLRRWLGGVPVIPVLRIERLADAVPLARALVAGGLSVLEVTLRTPVALEALTAMAEAVPEATVGVGTVLDADDLFAAKAAGARFAVSPGLPPSLIEASPALAGSLPLLPGVATATEVMTAREAGFNTVKCFPAAVAGGPAFLRSIYGPLPDMAFCPTGGVGAGSMLDYLALPNVLCVGGSWVAPSAAIEAGDWPQITELALAAVTAAGTQPRGGDLEP